MDANEIRYRIPEGVSPWPKCAVRVIFLSGDHDQCFLQVEPSGKSLLLTAHVTFVHFNPAGEQIASGPHHGAAQFMQHRPITHHMARNQTGNGVRVSWKIVAAVTEVR